MKHAVYLRVAFALVISSLVPMSAADQLGDFSYTTNGDAITITGYTGAGGHVVVPDVIDDLPVTTIGSYAFYECASLTGITIPDSVSTIGYWAFAAAANLADVVLGSNVASIVDGAFWGCHSLTDVAIPGSVTTIGPTVFSSCGSLTNIAVDVANANYSSTNGVLFNKTLTTLVQYPGGKTGAYTIPDSVTIIGPFAFAWCSSLNGIVFGSGVLTIEVNAFDRCDGLTSVTIPDNVTVIGHRAFRYCSGLTTVTIGNGVTVIRDSAFAWCENLVSLTLGGNLTLIEGYAFSQCTSLPAIVLPDSVVTLGNFVFHWCTSLTGVTLGSGLTTIGYGAFARCSQLPAISLPAGLITIGSSAFEDCSSLASIAIPASVSSIGDKPFYRCTSLPAIDVDVGNGFYSNVIIYYLPGTIGWGDTYADRPAKLWNPTFIAAGFSAGVISCTVTGTPGIPVAFEAGAHPRNGPWESLETTTLTDGVKTFPDPAAPSHSVRFYRVVGP